jgi:hypothetical protein
MQAAIKKLEGELSGVLSTIRQLQQTSRPSPPASAVDKASILELIDERLARHKEEMFSALDARIKTIQTAIDAATAKVDAAQDWRDETTRALSDLGSWRVGVDRTVDETRTIAQAALASLPGSAYQRNKQRLSDSSNNSAKGSAESEDTTPQITYTPGLPTETGLHEPAVIKASTPSSGAGDETAENSPPSPFVAKLAAPRASTSTQGSIAEDPSRRHSSPIGPVSAGPSHLHVPRPAPPKKRVSNTPPHVAPTQVERVRLLGKHPRGSDTSDFSEADSSAALRHESRQNARGHARKRIRVTEVGSAPSDVGAGVESEEQPALATPDKPSEYSIPLNDEPGRSTAGGSSFFASSKPIPSSPKGRRKSSLPIANLPFPLFSRPPSTDVWLPTAGADAPSASSNMQLPAVSPSLQRFRGQEHAVPPPTPPAARTLYGTELASDSRFGDPEEIGSSSVTALGAPSPSKKPWSRWMSRAPSSSSHGE